MLEYNRIAKNTLYLFLRMLVLMVISLYTSRLVLNALGVDNYGVYGVVGGLVAMVSYINQAMSSSSLRFITFSIGHDTLSEVKRVFNTTLSVHIYLIAIIVFLAETVGLWFFYNKLNIPFETRHTALVIYQLSVASTSLAFLALPFSTLVIAHERMSIFAWFSILDTVFKLAIVVLLIRIPGNKLLLYGWFMFGIQVLYTVIYVIYSYRHFPESHLDFSVDKRMSKEMVVFASWSMFGCTAAIACTQGLNILLNIFGGVAVNAARGLAVQVQSVITNFVGNFQTAINPQIIKSFATDALDDMHNLICVSAKFSFFLIFLIAMPLCLNMYTILHWWLEQVPEYLTVFLQLIIFITLIDCLSNPIMKAADASGCIRKYHVMVGSFLMLILPLGYMALKVGMPLYSVFIIQLTFSILALFLRLWIVRGLVQIKISYYCRNVLKPIGVVCVLSLLPILLLTYLPVTSDVARFFITSAVITASSTALIYRIGLTHNERESIVTKVKHLISTKK